MSSPMLSPLPSLVSSSSLVCFPLRNSPPFDFRSSTVLLLLFPPHPTLSPSFPLSRSPALPHAFSLGRSSKGGANPPMAVPGLDGCVYSCRHPLWGGNGECIEDGEHGRAACSCDTTYSTRDAFGHASCVPTRVLVMGYLFLAVVSMLCGSLLLRNANHYRYLSGAARSSRKIAIRFKILLSARFVSVASNVTIQYACVSRLCPQVMNSPTSTGLRSW